MPMCDTCGKPCLPSQAGKHATARKGSLGRYVRPGPIILAAMQICALETSSDGYYTRNFSTTPLSTADLFCVSDACLYMAVSDARKSTFYKLGQAEVVRKRKSEEKEACLASGVAISSFYHRNKFDRVRTTYDQIDTLLQFITPSGVVADICGGQRDTIYQRLSMSTSHSPQQQQQTAGGASVTLCVTNDLNHLVKSHYHLDATSSEFVKLWEENVEAAYQMVDWVVTSPPYGANASKCVMSALKLARKGVAMSRSTTEGLSCRPTDSHEKR
jgi:hypothetical protein